MTVLDQPAAAISDMLRDGRLSDAVARAAAAVKAAPTVVANRLILAELLVLEGAIDRAEAQLQVANEHAPAEATAITAMRHILRACVAQSAWHAEGAVPDFVDGPTERQSEAMRLALSVRGNDAAAAERARATLEAMPPVLARVDDAASVEVRDVCDLSQSGFEVLTLAGRYLWLAPERVESIRFSPPKRPRDLIWRKAETRLKDGRDATFLILAQYYDPQASEAHRLGRETDWIDEPGGTVRGRGQRVWLVGDEARDLLTVERMAFP